MLARVQIEHELDQRPLQPRARAGETDEPASAQFRRAFQIEKSQLRSERDVIQNRPSQIAVFRPSCAPPGFALASFPIGAFACGRFGILQEQIASAALRPRRLPVRAPRSRRRSGGLGLPVLPTILPATRFAADLFAQPFALGIECCSAVSILRRSASTASTSSIFAPHRRRRGSRAGFSRSRAVRE